jgi:hypothetical protein
MGSLRYFTRILFLGFLFSWIATSISMHEIDFLIHSPFERYMAHDLYYGYESIKTYYEFLPYTAVFHFCIGIIVGIISKPGDLQL